MSASVFYVFSAFKLRLGKGEIALNTDSIKFALVASTWAPSLDVDDDWADISANEISGDGYTAGGQAATNQLWTASGGTVTFDCDNLSWLAGASGLSARYVVAYDDTHVNKALICYSLLDTTPADYSASDGQTIDIILPATGAFQLT